MKFIDLEERKQIQMQILDAVDKFCQEKNIRYSLACGTMLGAIRHGGYIPWDDDIDIQMLREDYEIFEKEFPEVLNGRYQLVSIHRNNKWPNLYSKVFDNRTIVKEKIIQSIPLGINIDIFPHDDIPDDEETWTVFNKKRWKDFEYTRKSQRAISKSRPWWQNILILVLKVRYINFNAHANALEREKYAKLHNNKGNRRVFETSFGAFGKPFTKSLYDDIIDIPFENRKYKCFRNYHEYLTCTFGDYMTPPPPEKRISYHTYDTYWKEEQ